MLRPFGTPGDNRTMADDTMADEVRGQYEALPYPARDPADEKKRLVRTWLDDLPMINHYCFGGRARFDGGFRALVAGGGTGDGTIFLAEQLRHSNAEVVHVDVSGASLEIAKRRAGERGLANIRWVHDSLLDAPRLGLGTFDYINCVGVLHHLEDPEAGLRALLAVLAEGGALGVMVYARYGRTGVYHMQSLMRLVNEGVETRAARIDNTRQMLDALPRSNWFKRGEDQIQDHRGGDAGIYDLLLHSRDRAYSVPELHEWLVEKHGLNVELTDVNHGRAAYLPHMLFGPRPPAVLKALRKLPPWRQYEAAELFTGRIQTHSFFANRTPNRAPYGDASLTPFFFHEPITGASLARVFAAGRGRPVVLDHAHTGISVTVNPGRYGPDIVRHIDGNTSFATIFGRLRQQYGLDPANPSDEALFEDFRDIYETLNALDRLLLRA